MPFSPKNKFSTWNKFLLKSKLHILSFGSVCIITSSSFRFYFIFMWHKTGSWKGAFCSNNHLLQWTMGAFYFFISILPPFLRQTNTWIRQTNALSRFFWRVLPRSLNPADFFLQVLKHVNVSVLQRRHVTVRREPWGEVQDVSGQCCGHVLRLQFSKFEARVFVYRTFFSDFLWVK